MPSVLQHLVLGIMNPALDDCLSTMALKKSKLTLLNCLYSHSVRYTMTFISGPHTVLSMHSEHLLNEHMLTFKPKLL